MWTLVGAGLKSFEETSKPMANVIPPKSTWIKERVSHIAPDENAVFTTNDQKVRINFVFCIFFSWQNRSQAMKLILFLSKHIILLLFIHDVKSKVGFNAKPVPESVTSSAMCFLELIN